MEHNAETQRSYLAAGFFSMLRGATIATHKKDSQEYEGRQDSAQSEMLTNFELTGRVGSGGTVSGLLLFSDICNS